jgi:predicted dehydrogenase
VGGVLRYGMVGGGPGAFIGDVHRRAIAMDGLAVLAAGAFSSEAEKTLETGRALGLAEARLYSSWAEMAAAEASRPDGIDFVVVVTPNHLHHPVAKAFLEAGIHVVCDKPLALASAQGAELAALARAKGLLFCVTYTYTGYPMVKEARALVAAGRIGKLRFVNAEYPQEFFARPVEREGSKQAEWRFDPARSGAVGTLGDLGTHIENLVSYVTGLELARVSARLDTIVPDRALDDNDCVLTEYEGGAKGLYWSSQAAAGHDNALRIRVYGSEGSLSWCQEEHDHLRFCRLGGPEETWTRGREGLGAAARAFSRLPAGHPEGYFAAFANLYRSFASRLLKLKAELPPEAADLDYPGIEAGISGLRFVEACVQSSKADAAWVAVKKGT